MRSFLFAGIIAASIGVAACSSNGGSSSLPAGSQAAAPLNPALIHVVGARPDARCPKTYSGCITVSAASGGSILLCYGSCGPVNYQWSSTFSRTKKGTPFGKFTLRSTRIRATRLPTPSPSCDTSSRATANTSGCKP